MSAVVFERTGDTFTARLRNRGIGRFFDAAFLSAWLCFWFVAECFAVAAATGAVSQLFGFQLFKSLGEPARASAAMATLILAFILFWLALWTAGGIAAGHQLLRALRGVEWLEANPHQLVVSSHAGPFRRRQVFARRDISWIGLQQRNGPLVAECGANRSVLASLGTPMDRRELRDALRVVLDLPSPERWRELASNTPPSGWDFAPGAAYFALRRSRAPRIKQSRAMAFIALLFSTAVAFSLCEESSHPGRAAGLLVCGALAMLFSAGALWLGFGEETWQLRGQRARFVRSFFGARSMQEYSPCSLSLTSETDGDGDLRETLLLEAPTGKRRLLSRTNEPRVLLHLGLFLAARTGIPFYAPTGAEER